jgi:hypothetical protein
MRGFLQGAAKAAFVAVFCAAFGAAQTFTLLPTADNTLYEDGSGSLSNGVGSTLYCGRTGPSGGNLARRALLRFDVASVAPPGTVCVFAELALEASQTNGPSFVASLHRVGAAWGEGASDAGVPGGFGAAAAPGDATWLHTNFPGSLWTTPGGDFIAAASSTAVVAGPGAVTFGSSAALRADVDAMAANPATNFGWIVVSPELTQQAARFESRESPGFEPFLTVVFAPATPVASKTIVGAGCPGTNPLPFSLDTSGPPTIGEASFAFVAANGPAFGIAQLVFSTGVVAPQPIGGGCSVFLDLTGVGLYVAAGFGPFPIFLDGTGAGFFFLPIPPDPNLSGFTLAAQAVVADANAPAFVVLSNALLLQSGS